MNEDYYKEITYIKSTSTTATTLRRKISTLNPEQFVSYTSMELNITQPNNISI